MKGRSGKKTNVSGIFILVVLVIAIIAIFLFSPVKIPTEPGETPSGGTGPGGSQWNCGDMQIDLNSVKEAVSYTRFGIIRPASSDSKFEILKLTITNKGTTVKDFSGYRLQIIADSSSYSPVSFSSIEKITLLDGSTIDYSCSEAKIASISRLTLQPGGSETGCKIFQVLKTLRPASLNLYDLSGLKCSIELQILECNNDSDCPSQMRCARPTCGIGVECGKGVCVT